MATSKHKKNEKNDSDEYKIRYNHPAEDGIIGLMIVTGVLGGGITIITITIAIVLDVWEWLN